MRTIVFGWAVVWVGIAILAPAVAAADAGDTLQMYSPTAQADQQACPTPCGSTIRGLVSYLRCSGDTGCTYGRAGRVRVGLIGSAGTMPLTDAGGNFVMRNVPRGVWAIGAAAPTGVVGCGPEDYAVRPNIKTTGDPDDEVMVYVWIECFSYRIR